MKAVEKKKNSGSSTVFKVGAISLAFLILGYQSALFIHRAAALRAEVIRDHPDTVYIIREIRTDGGEAADAGTVQGGQKESAEPIGESVRIERKESPHGPAVQQIRKRTRKVENFRFNPNTVGKEELQRLGFSEKQAAAIINYRAKGGRFHRKSDFAKSFVVADSVYRRLEPYIDIPRLDINKADSAALDALPGIGPYFAAKIIEYRNELGGYTEVEQLMDIDYFDREKFDALSDLVICGGDDGSE